LVCPDYLLHGFAISEPRWITNTPANSVPDAGGRIPMIGLCCAAYAILNLIRLMRGSRCKIAYAIRLHSWRSTSPTNADMTGMPVPIVSQSSGPDSLGHWPHLTTYHIHDDQPDCDSLLFASGNYSPTSPDNHAGSQGILVMYSSLVHNLGPQKIPCQYSRS
jgi:hypothetical protein